MTSNNNRRTVVSALVASSVMATSVAFLPAQHRAVPAFVLRAEPPIVSPFDATNELDSPAADLGDSASTTTATAPLEGPLDLTYENVDLVLDEMRPYLMQDGGNVAIQEIDGPVVRLELQVCCCRS